MHVLALGIYHHFAQLFDPGDESSMMNPFYTFNEEALGWGQGAGGNDP
jgi:hypothetical protein